MFELKNRKGKYQDVWVTNLDEVTEALGETPTTQTKEHCNANKQTKRNISTREQKSRNDATIGRVSRSIVYHRDMSYIQVYCTIVYLHTLILAK